MRRLFRCALGATLLGCAGPPDDEVAAPVTPPTVAASQTASTSPPAADAAGDVIAAAQAFRVGVDLSTQGRDTEAIAAFDAVNGNWTRGDAKNSLTGDNLGPKVTPRSEDIGLAWDLGELGPGEYTVQISLVEDGAPWSTGQNSWSAEYTLVITQIA